MDQNQNIEKLKELLLNQTPILFLGAGFALGAKTNSGREIPAGDSLKKIIIEDFLRLRSGNSEHTELMSYSLPQVCQYCANKQDPLRLADFLTQFFNQVKPNEFHLQLTNYFWKKIYTTNIDDLVENIYYKNDKQIVVQHYPRNFTQKKDNVTEYFKLHGSVTNPSQGFTFSTDQYVDSMISNHDYRFSSLSVDMHSENFIFLGSSSEEINLDYYFKLYENTGYASTRGKIFFINPKPNLLLQSKIEKIQGIIINWNAKEFLEFVTSIANKNKSVQKYNLNKDLYHQGLRNINSILNTYNENLFYDSKLYLGFEPQWEDIFAEWDFVDSRVLEKFHEFYKITQDKSSSIFALYGKPYVGKSTFLKRIGNELRALGYETYNFNGKYFNYHPLLQYIKKSDATNFALIVDNASYYYGALKKIVSFVPNGKKIILVTASRPYFHFKWRYHFVGENFIEHLIEPSIDETYSKEIINKLDLKGYLGELKNKSNLSEKIEHVMNHNDVMSLLFSLTYGKGFVNRLQKDLDPLLEVDSYTKNLLLGLAIFNKLDIPHFPIELIGLLSNHRAKEYLKKIDGFIKITKENNIQLRSAFFTSNILDSVQKIRIIDIVKEILIYIAAQVNNTGYIYWNEIYAALTKEKRLRKSLDLNSREIKQLLYDVRNYYSENFNFWIQLGIAEQREKDFEKALNHFKQAEALNPTSYMVQNAIGRNFLKQANAQNDLYLAYKYFKSGEEILLDLIENREEFQAKAFSTHCYLHEKMVFIDKFNIDITDDEIKKMGNYLRKIIEKDPNDYFGQHINNTFMRFLKKRNKGTIMKFSFQDLSRLKALLTDYNLDIEDFMDDN